MEARSTRDQIVDAADRLIYEQGYEHTSFAHIAEAVGISRGNFYHHFKTKDEILEAVIEARIGKTRSMLAQWEARTADPAERIRSFAHMMIDNRGDIRRFGCPVGTLCAELAKLQHPSKAEANKLLVLFREWLRDQFAQIGREVDAADLAMHALARSQGVATLAAAFNSEAFIRREVALMDEWLQSCIPTRRPPRPKKK
jgi:AcrR family transcriptional regulator